MSKFLFFVCSFLIAFSAFNSAEAGRRQSAKSSPNSMANFNRHIGTYFARKIVMQKLIGGAVCNECKEVVSELYSELGNPQLEKDVEAVIDNYVCPKMGAYKQICADFVAEELPTVFKELEAALADSQAFCVELELCSKPPTALKKRISSKMTVGKIRHPHFNANGFNLGGMEEEEMMF